MARTYTAPGIDEYLRKRLMPVEGAIPHLPGIEMYGNSVPAETVGGDLFEYINFQQRYDIDVRIEVVLRLKIYVFKQVAANRFRGHRITVHLDSRQVRNRTFHRHQALPQIFINTWSGVGSCHKRIQGKWRSLL